MPKEYIIEQITRFIKKLLKRRKITKRKELTTIIIAVKIKKIKKIVHYFLKY